MSLHDPRHQLQAAADAHWDRYLSTVCTGGTPEQRQWAFDRWLEHDQKLARHDRHANTNRETLTDMPAVQGAQDLMHDTTGSASGRDAQPGGSGS